MNWKKIHFGKISNDDIMKHIKDPKWQELREDLKGKTLEEKYKMLHKWLLSHKNSHSAQVQVTNYINALARAGLVHI